MEWLTADWVRCSSRAVCVKLLVRASVRNARSCLLSRGKFIHESRSSFPCELRGAFIAPKFLNGTDMAQDEHDGKKQRFVIKKIQTGSLFARKCVCRVTHLPDAKRPQAALRLGFVPLTDCAPLVMAQELGIFRKYGINVVLSRELGWATIRDKVIYRELDAAHAVAGMPFAATLGLGSIRCDCLTALVLNLHGNAITLSNDLWKKGVRDGTSLRGEILRSRGRGVFTFGVVYPFYSHNFLLRDWLSA